jgi:hypothetical protein
MAQPLQMMRKKKRRKNSENAHRNLSRLLKGVLVAKFLNLLADHFHNVLLNKEMGIIEDMNDELVCIRHGIIEVDNELSHGNITAISEQNMIKRA